MTIKAALIVSCSATRTIEPSLRGIDLTPNVTMQEALEEWINRLQDAADDGLYTPGELYRGIGFNSVVKAHQLIEDDHVYIASAGQGLMKIDQEIIPYDFTTDPKHKDSINKIVTKEPFVLSSWWQRINRALYDDESPVATLLLNPKIDLVIVSLQKRFCKFLVDDILSVWDNAAIEKLRIVVVGSSSSWLPKQLRGCVVHLSRDMLGGMPGNRNDVAQRAGLYFVRMLDVDTGKLSVDMSVAEMQQVIGIVGVGSNKMKEKENFDDIFAQHPELLELDNPDKAYTEAKHLGYSSLSTLRMFRSAWLSSKGIENVLGVVGAGVEPSALSALKAVSEQLTGLTEKVITWDDELKSLRLVKVFLGVAKNELGEDMKFNASVLLEWATVYCEGSEGSGANGSLELPVHFRSANKLSNLLSVHLKGLGLISIKVPGSSASMFGFSDVQ